MSTVYSKSLIYSPDDPDGLIPGLRPQLDPRIKLLPETSTRVEYHHDTCATDALPRVLSREDLVENYSFEKKVGHLSSELQTARKYVNDEFNLDKNVSIGQKQYGGIPYSTVMKNNVAIDNLHSMQVDGYKSIQGEVANKASNARYEQNNNVRGTANKQQNTSFNIEEYLKEVKSRISDNFGQSTAADIQKQEQSDRIKELEDLMKRMNNLENEAKTVSMAPTARTNSKDTVSITHKPEPSFDIEKYLKEVNAMISTVPDASRCVKVRQKSERERELEDLLRRMDNLQNAPVPAPIPPPPSIVQPVNHVNNFKVGAHNEERRDTSPHNVDNPLVKHLNFKIEQLSAQIEEQEEHIAKVRFQNKKEREAKAKSEVEKFKYTLEKEISQLHERLNKAEQREQTTNDRLDHNQHDSHAVRLAYTNRAEATVNDPALKELKEQINGLNFRLNDMEQEKAALNAKLDSAQHQLHTMKSSTAKGQKQQKRSRLQQQRTRMDDSAYIDSSMIKMKEELDDNIVALDARICEVRLDGGLLSDRLDDTQHDLDSAKLEGLKTHEELIEKLNAELERLEEEVNVSIQQELEKVRGNTEKKIERVEGRRRRDETKIADIKKRHREVSAQQREDFSKFQQVQKETIARIERDVKRNSTGVTANKRNVRKLAKAVQKDFTIFKGETKERFNAVCNMQERVYLSLLNRLNRLARKTHTTDVKRKDEIDQLRRYIQELEQCLKTATQEESGNDNELRKTLCELKERGNRLESERTQILRECATNKDGTILGLISAIKEQGTTKCVDNKVQFINTWNIGSRPRETVLPKYGVVETSPVTKRKNAGHDNYPMPTDGVVVSARRKRRPGTKRASRVHQTKKDSRQKTEFNESDSDISQEAPLMVISSDEGMPEAQVVVREHTGQDQCVSESISRKRREHLSDITEKSEDNEDTVTTKPLTPEQNDSSTSFDEDLLSDAAAISPIVNSEADIQVSDEEERIIDEVNDRDLTSTEEEEEPVVEEEGELVSEEPPVEAEKDASGDEGSGFGCLLKGVGGLLCIPCLPFLACAAGASALHSKARKGKKEKKDEEKTSKHKDTEKKEKKDKKSKKQKDNDKEKNGLFSPCLGKKSANKKKDCTKVTESDEDDQGDISSEETIDGDNESVTILQVVDAMQPALDEIQVEEEDESEVEEDQQSENEKVKSKEKKGKEKKGKAIKDKQKDKKSKEKSSKNKDTEKKEKKDKKSKKKEGYNGEKNGLSCVTGLFSSCAGKKTGKKKKGSKEVTESDTDDQGEISSKETLDEDNESDNDSDNESVTILRVVDAMHPALDEIQIEDESKDDEEDESEEESEDEEEEQQNEASENDQIKSKEKKGKTTKEKKKKDKKSKEKTSKEKKEKNEKKSKEKTSKEKDKEKEDKKDKKSKEKDTEKKEKKDKKSKEKTSKEKKEKKDKKSKEKTSKEKDTEKEDKKDKKSKEKTSKEKKEKKDKKSKEKTSKEKDTEKEDKKDKKSKKKNDNDDVGNGWFTKLFSSCIGKTSGKSEKDCEEDPESDEDDQEETIQEKMSEETSEECIKSVSTIIQVVPKPSGEIVDAVQPAVDEIQVEGHESFTAEPEVKEAANPVVIPAAKDADKPADIPAAKPTVITAGKPEAIPATKEVGKPVDIPAAKPVAITATKEAAEPAAITATKPVAIPATKEVAKPAAIPAAKDAANPAAIPAAKPVAITATKEVAKPATIPAAKEVVKPAANIAAKPVSITATKVVAKPATIPAAKEVVKPAANIAAKPVAITATKVVAKPATTFAAKKANIPVVKEAAKKSAKKTSPINRSKEDEQLESILEDLREPEEAFATRVRKARATKQKTKREKLLDDVLSELREPPSAVRQKRTESEIEMDNLLAELPNPTADDQLISNNIVSSKRNVAPPVKVNVPVKRYTDSQRKSGQITTSVFSPEEEDLMNGCLGKLKIKNSWDSEEEARQITTAIFSPEEEDLMNRCLEKQDIKNSWDSEEEALMDSCLKTAVFSPEEEDLMNRCLEKQDIKKALVDSCNSWDSLP